MLKKIKKILFNYNLLVAAAALLLIAGSASAMSITGTLEELRGLFGGQEQNQSLGGTTAVGGICSGSEPTTQLCNVNTYAMQVQQGLTIDAGGLTITSGNETLTSGNLTLTNGTYAQTNNVATTTALVRTIGTFTRTENSGLVVTTGGDGIGLAFEYQIEDDSQSATTTAKSEVVLTDTSSTTIAVRKSDYLKLNSAYIYQTTPLFSLVGNGTNGRLGISSTTPWGALAINSEAGENSLVIGSSTATYLRVDSNGVLQGNQSLGDSADLRWDGTTNTHLLFADVSAEKIGLGTSTPFATYGFGAGGTATTSFSTGKFCMYTQNENGEAVYLFLSDSAANRQPFATSSTSCF